MNIKKPFNFIIIILVIKLTFAQTIYGVIKDSDSNLLFGATIYNSSNSKIGITNEMGVFSVESVKGENKLFISYVGYTSKIITLESTGDSINRGSIVLENDSLDEIVISGTLRQVSKLKSAVPIELYTADFFKATPKASFFEAIEGINGVIDNSTARVFSEATRPAETEKQARTRRFTGGEVDSPSRNLARYVDKIADDYIDNLDVMMIYRLDRFGRGGHHRPFNEQGFAGVRIMETNEHYDRQHQDLRTESGRVFGDTIAGVNFEYAAKLTALNAVALASMAMAPAPPSQVTIEGMVSPDTTLKWAKVAGAAGYKIYWRLTTSPQWSWGREVGDVSEHMLKNIVIDNYIFGVASLNADGIESPVVFPGVIGAFWE